ncbi:DUF177 domain-containing protein [Brevibacillus composti]|uniref:DUF177 domain-containing protein n=1 Tax=Brevibacillus composti TaxID=2796470 RepID=A0A7T5ENY3_9BACL|nr:DUF177 domain-containing protein [Brevibacillus composti]QQE76074.1 DUF177 domain-containing protein [Brevibacillus composti]QUO43102.1 DUF177 domain-containing protein [Brevibacillus composti]
MNIKIADLDRREGEPLAFRLTLDPDELKARHQEIRGLTPVETKGEAAKLGDLYYINGDMQADVKFVCARCLRPFEQHVAIPFSETFAPAESLLADEEDSEILPLESDEIELAPLLQENFLLDIPAFPLCEDDCKGLCPTCGVNRNEQPCSCKNERIDPRLAGLADFFKDSK